MGVPTNVTSIVAPGLKLVFRPRVSTPEHSGTPWKFGLALNLANPRPKNQLKA